MVLKNKDTVPACVMLVKLVHGTVMYTAYLPFINRQMSSFKCSVNSLENYTESRRIMAKKKQECIIYCEASIISEPSYAYSWNSLTLWASMAPSSLVSSTTFDTR